MPENNTRPVAPTSGSVSIFGCDVFAKGPKVRQQIGYVPEDPWLYPWMTVRQVIRFASCMYDRWCDALAEDLLIEFALPPDRTVRELSKGMRVKAALLVALAHRPRLLILDEPMSGLDPLARDELIEILVKRAVKTPRASSSRPTRSTTSRESRMKWPSSMPGSCSCIRPSMI